MLLFLVACNAGPAGPDLTPFACTLTVQAEGVDLSGFWDPEEKRNGLRAR